MHEAKRRVWDALYTDPCGRPKAWPSFADLELDGAIVRRRGRHTYGLLECYCLPQLQAVVGGGYMIVHRRVVPGGL
jgi:hypothetical protein